MLASKYSRKPKLGANGPIYCHVCGKLAMTLQQGECRLSDGSAIPELEWLECQNCGEKLFDSANVNRMLTHRRSLRQATKRSKELFNA